MSDLPWLRVWLQGGPADGHRFATMVEPPRTLYVVRDPILPTWVRVPVSHAGALAYVRVPGAERSDLERIYYPDE